MTDEFVLKRVNDETLVISLNEEELVHVTHDEYGWSGMELVEDLVREIASRLHIAVEEEDGEESDGE